MNGRGGGDGGSNKERENNEGRASHYRKGSLGARRKWKGTITQVVDGWSTL